MKPMTLTPGRQARVAIWEQEQLEQYAASGMPPWAVAEYATYLRDLAWQDDLDAARWEVVGHMLAPDNDPTPAALDRYVASVRTWKTASIFEQAESLGRQLGVSKDVARQTILNAQAALGESVESGGMCALYRHYDVADQLLYVGIAADPDRRSEQHAADSKWHRFSARMDVEWFECREDATAAEREAIDAETPVFNQTHNKKARDRAVAYLFDQLGEATA